MKQPNGQVTGWLPSRTLKILLNSEAEESKSSARAWRGNTYFAWSTYEDGALV